MNAQTGDTLLKELLELTKALLSAAQQGDTEVIEQQLEKRQQCLDTIMAAGGLAGPRTGEQQALLDRITLLDQKANRQIKKLMQECGQSVSDYDKKAAGLRRYNNSKYNMASGQLIDKRD